MISLGLRLAFAGGKEAIGRLAMIAVAVAIGVGLLLSILGSLNAFNVQNDRYAWLQDGYAGAQSADAPVATDPLLWLLRADYFQGERIARIDLAATGPDSRVPPGIPALPGPGEFYASPAMTELLRGAPAAQLGDRFPGTQIGILGDAALPAPESLIIVIGHEPDELAQHPEVSITSPGVCRGDCAPVGANAKGVTLVLSVVAAALLFPVLVFIASATRLSAARREQRFAAMRLVGATPRQVSGLATVESSIATFAGVIAGFGFFFALRPVTATIPFTGDRFFAGDVSLRMTDVLLVSIGVPIAAAAAAWFALRRVNVSPLGVARRVTPAPPAASRVLPLCLGVAWLAYLAFASEIGDNRNPTVQAAAYLAGVLLVMLGLVIAGPWLTMIGSRLMVRRSRRPASLIAARRLNDNPRAAFRAISGLVLAVFVGTCAIGIITTIVAYHGGSAGDTASSTGTLVHRMFRGGPEDSPAPPLSDVARHELTAIPGVVGVATVRIDISNQTPTDLNGGGAWFYASCAEIAQAPTLGRCPVGAEVVSIVPHFGAGVIDTSTPMSDTTWPAAGMTVDELSQLPMDTIIVSTDGSSAAVEEARTTLERVLPTDLPPMTLSEFNAGITRTIDNYRRLANVVLLTSLPIAGCSLAVSVAGGLAERRRPFSLLRLTGVPLVMLRRVVTLEAAVPLLISVVVSACAGLAAAALFLQAQLDQTLQPPTLTYYALVIGGVGVSLAIIGSTMPLLARITGPETAREE